MGTEPEEIEHALRRERTLPKPGERPVRMGEGRKEPRDEPEDKVSSPNPERQSPEAAAKVAAEAHKGAEGGLLDADEERRFGLRGGRWNAASKRDRT